MSHKTRQGKAFTAYGIAMFLLTQGVTTSEWEKLIRTMAKNINMLFHLVYGCITYQIHTAGMAMI